MYSLKLFSTHRIAQKELPTDVCIVLGQIRNIEANLLLWCYSVVKKAQGRLINPPVALIKRVLPT